jgi:hypothetical protein
VEPPVKGLFLFLVLGGCTKELTDAPILPPRAPATDAGTAKASTWRGDWCHVDEPAPSSERALSFAGECRLLQTSPALCRPEEDDFYVLVKRPLPGGRSLNFYVNVERFHGDGDYRSLAQLHVVVRDRGTLYRWANVQGDVVLSSSGEKRFITLRGVSLSAELGTPASGVIVLDGTLECSDSPAPLEAP